MQTGKRLQGAESSGCYLGDRRAIEDAEANREPHKALDKRFAGSVSSLRRHRLPRRFDSVSSIIDPAPVIAPLIANPKRSAVTWRSVRRLRPQLDRVQIHA
jgi:hypothetical protein